MPGFLRGLTVVGTAAMLWVGGAIIVHGLAQLGWPGIEHVVETIAHAFDALGSAVAWLAEAGLFGVFGFVVGTAVMPLAIRVIGPALRAVGLSSDDGAH
jgi:hypothetical protein